MTRRTLKIEACKSAALLILLLMIAGVARANTYYIDYSTGSNSNAGTSKGAPWKTHPYMQTGNSCTGGVTGWGGWTHHTGDQYIFKGGVTWPAACFTFAITNSGASGNSDYYGVDVTWYAGSSFTRPIFDMANSKATAGPMLTIHGSNITVDNIELAHLKITRGTGAGCTDASIAANNGFTGQTGVLLERLFIHDWTIDNVDFSYYTHETGAICQDGGSLSTIDTVEMSDQNTTFVDGGGHTLPFGECWHNEGEVKNSNCHHVGEGYVSIFGSFHDSQIHDLDGTAVENYASQISGSRCPGNPSACTHTNVIHMSDTAPGDGPIYNDLIYNNADGVTIFVCAANNVYNNVMWNNTNASILWDTANGSGDCPGVTTSTVGNVYNNTVDCSNGNYCFRNVQRSSGQVASIVNIRNNLWITNATGLNVMCYNATGSSCGNISTSSAVDHNYTMMTSEATSFGFTSINKYKPASSDSNVSGKGANLTSSCSGNLSALCQDTSGAAWFGGSAITRPTGTTAWDLGAYMGQGGGGAGPPSITISSPAPGTLSGSINLTASCTPQGSATISSIQFTIDGFPFSAAGTSSPYTLSWNTTTAANATHVIGATCTDSNAQVGTAATVSVTVSNSIPGCFISTDNDSGSLSWSANQAFTPQSANFTATVTVTPNTADQDSVIALSENAMAAYGDGAALLRFNSNGFIDVYKGTISNYTSDNSAPYTAGTAYSFTYTINFTGPNAGTYSVSETSPSSIAIATNYAFRSTALIASLGFINAISDNTTPDTAKVCNFQVGSAASLTFSPASLNFGNVTVGSNSTQTITTTTSGGSANFTGVAISGNSDFTILTGGTCTGSVPSSCTTQIQFAPTSAALETATVTFTDDATGSPQSVAVSGTGVPATPTLSVNPASVNFGSVHIQTTSSSGPIVLTIASGPVTFTGTPSLSGANAADFALASNTCTGAVSASSCQTVVSFTPSLVAAESATLTYTDNATGSPQSVPLTGVGYLAPHAPTAVHATVE